MPRCRLLSNSQGENKNLEAAQSFKIFQKAISVRLQFINAGRLETVLGLVCGGIQMLDI